MSRPVDTAIVGTWEPDGWSAEREREDIYHVLIGLGHAYDLAQAHGWDTIWIVTPTDHTFGGPIIEGAFGRGDVNALRSRDPIPFKDKSLRHATEKTLHNRGVDGAILVLVPTIDLLDVIDTLYTNSRAVVVVPDVHNIDRWIGTWGPMDLLTDERRPLLEITDPDVRKAMDDVVAGRMDAGHPTDKKAVQKWFSALRRRGKELDPVAIQAHLMREANWDLFAAAGIAKLAAGRSRSK